MVSQFQQLSDEDAAMLIEWHETDGSKNTLKEMIRNQKKRSL